MKRLAFALLVTASLVIAAAILPQTAYAHHVLEQITVPGNPMRMAVAGDTLFVSSLTEPKVSVVDTKTDKIVGTMNTTKVSMALKAIPELDKIYVATYETGALEVHRLSSLNITKGISLPNSEQNLWYNPSARYYPQVTLLTGGWSIDYDPANKTLYVANYNGNNVVVIDTTKDAVVTSIQVPAHPYDLKVDSSAKTVVVTSLATNKLTFISTETNQVIDSMDVGLGSFGIALDGQRHMAYVTHFATNDLSVVDIATKQIVAKIYTPGHTRNVVVDPAEQKVYVSFLDTAGIAKIDASKNQIETMIETDGTTQDLVLNTQSHKVYASIHGTDQVIAVGPQSISTTLPVITIEKPYATVGLVDVHSQDVQVSNLSLEIGSKTMKMDVNSPDGGDVTMKIPREMIDVQQGGNDTSYQAMIDGKQAKIEAVSTDSSTREVSVFVPKGAKSLEIIGTTAIPEFGALPILVLGAMVAVMIFLARRQSWNLRIH